MGPCPPLVDPPVLLRPRSLERHLVREVSHEEALHRLERDAKLLHPAEAELDLMPAEDTGERGAVPGVARGVPQERPLGVPDPELPRHLERSGRLPCLGATWGG